MKTPKFLLSGILGIALAGVVLTGCHKDSTAPSTPPASSSGDYTAAEDDANATYTANDAKNVSDAAMQSNGHSPSNFNSYYNANIVWAKDTGAGDTLYIIFPATPTKCGDNRYREGEIIVYWPYKQGMFLWQAYLDSSVTVTELFRGYAVGDSKTSMNVVSGTRTWTNEGQNQNGYENWDFTANLSIVYANNGGTATWTSTRNNVLTEVNGVWYYQITGSASGTTRKNVSYSLNISSPLYVTAEPWWLGGCAWIESGTLDITGNFSTISVNFGNLGTCDDVAVATINNTNYTFYMW